MELEFNHHWRYTCTFLRRNRLEQHRQHCTSWAQISYITWITFKALHRDWLWRQLQVRFWRPWTASKGIQISLTDRGEPWKLFELESMFIKVVLWRNKVADNGRRRDSRAGIPDQVPALIQLRGQEQQGSDGHGRQCRSRTNKIWRLEVGSEAKGRINDDSHFKPGWLRKWKSRGKSELRGKDEEINLSSYSDGS